MPQTHPLSADWRDLLALTKPRVMSLVVFTGLCGLLAAPVPVHPVLGFAAVLCIALGAGAANAELPGAAKIDPARAAVMGHAGLVRARREFSVAQMAERTAAVYAAVSSAER